MTILWHHQHHQADLPDFLMDLVEKGFLSLKQDWDTEKSVFLHYDEHGLSLCKCKMGAKGKIEKEKGRVQVDFVHGAAQHRRTQGGGELIAKAVQHTAKPIVWDATGGLGRDAFVLASLGLNVRIFEQNAAVFALLRDGLERAQSFPEIQPIIQNIQLHHGDASQMLMDFANEWGAPDVVYLDPMYPERQKSAAVKKEMAYFHELVGMPETENETKLFEAARQVAKKRIVVKRPRLGEFLCQTQPAYQYSGKSTRFDVYLPLPKL